MNKLPIIEKARNDSVFKSNGRSGRPPSLTFLFIMVMCLFLVLIVRLFQLTIVKGDYYRRLSEENRIKEIVIEARRGTILDRNGAVIASNTEAIEGKKKDRLVSSRTVINGPAFGHILGYRQQADQNDLNNDLCINKMRLGDSTGKKGVEKVFECDLRGVNGRKLLELNASGKPLRTLGQYEPIHGKTIQLSIDSALQQKAYELFTQHISASSSASPQAGADFPKPELLQKGAVIAAEPTTGRIMTLYSNPSFDPNDFERNNSEKITSYFKDKKQPLFDRVTEGAYPPGSIFKLIVAAGALEEKAMKADTIIEDAGQIKAGPNTFGNWYFLQYGRTDGEVNMTKAIQRSNDIYFYRAGERLGESHIKQWSEKFGLGRVTKLPFKQSEGLVPSPFWKEEILNEQWYLGDTYNFSIGQGYLLTTPIQMLQMTSAFANGGYLCDPQLLNDAKPQCKKLDVSEENIKVIKEGMEMACATGGTAWPFFDFKVKGKEMKVGCKTGTAEAHGYGNPSPHAWFTIFAPFDNPEIVMTVLVENGGEGSSVAAPIARELLKTYFESR